MVKTGWVVDPESTFKAPRVMLVVQGNLRTLKRIQKKLE